MSDPSEEERLERYVELVREVRHEINNPLTSLLAEAQLMLMDEDQLSSEQKRAVKVIEEQAQRIRELVRRLEEVK